MKKMIRKELPWLIAFILWFFILPLLFPLAKSIENDLSIVMLMMGNPVFCVAAGLLYGMKNGRRPEFLIYPAVCGVIASLLYFGTGAIAYALVSVAVSAMSLLFGSWSYHKKLTEAERWEEKQKRYAETAAATAAVKEKEIILPAASKTAQKNQQRAAAKKAKERAEKEKKQAMKNQPAPKKKKHH